MQDLAVPPTDSHAFIETKENGGTKKDDNTNESIIALSNTSKALHLADMLIQNDLRCIQGIF